MKIPFTNKEILLQDKKNKTNETDRSKLTRQIGYVGREQRTEN